MIVGCLEGGPPVARRMAAYALSKVAAEQRSGSGAERVMAEALGAALADPEPEVRRAALVALRRLPGVPEPVRTKVTGMTQDPDLHVRRTALAVLKTWYSDARDNWQGKA